MHDKILADCLSTARTIGWGAAEILLEAQRSSFSIEKSGSSPVTSADLAANQYILHHLQAAFGTEDFGYLSEETYQSPAADDRFKHRWVWIIDPLDGTKEFINRTEEYAVHIALVADGRPEVAVVACPAKGTLYAAIRGGGTTLEQRDRSTQPLKVSAKTQPTEMTIVTSRSHRNGQLTQLLEQFPVKNQHRVGSIGCKIATIVEQEADLYLSLSSSSAPKDWDLAAPELILTEAGGQFTHFDGTPLHYNQTDVSQWGGLLASNGSCHQEFCREAERILESLDRS